MTTFLKTLLLSVAVMLAGCGGEEEIAEIDDPELVAVAFFNALYNEKDVKKAASVCSPQLSRILLHYRSSDAVGRHMFNMSYDTVVVSPDDSGVKVREQFKKDANITLYFEGEYNGERIKDVKRVAMVQRKGNWVIDKILKDPF